MIFTGIGLYLLAAAAYVGVMFLPLPAFAQQRPQPPSDPQAALFNLGVQTGEVITSLKAEKATLMQWLIEAQQKEAKPSASAEKP